MYRLCESPVDLQARLGCRSDHPSARPHLILKRRLRDERWGSPLVFLLFTHRFNKKWLHLTNSSHPLSLLVSSAAPSRKSFALITHLASTTRLEPKLAAEG